MKLFWPVRIEDGAFINQQNLFGANPANYAQFGIQGHDGLDFVIDTGKPVYASHDGNVEYNVMVGGLGHYAKIISSECTTYYGHLQAFVGINRPVKAGDKIGLANSTGNSTGSHVHLALLLPNYDYNNGYHGYVDPQPYLANERERPMTNQTKVVLGKDGKTVYLATPIAMAWTEFVKQAGVEGIDVPSPVPPANTL